MTADEMVEHDQGVAVAVVRRIDRDAGSTGVGLVEHVLRGSLPEQLPLDLDDGASCKPWLGHGQIATLAFEQARGSWRTFDCSMLDSATSLAPAYGPFATDPRARGEPVVLLWGSLPRAGLVLLDADLQPLATALEPSRPFLVESCDGDVVAVTAAGDEYAVARLSLPGLTVVERRVLDELPPGTTGSWMPVPEPWLDGGRLLLADQARGLRSPPGAVHRVVDLHLRETDAPPGVGELVNSAVRAAGGHVVGVGGAELTVVTPGGSVRTSTDPRTAGAWDALLLGELSPDAGTEGPLAVPVPSPPSSGGQEGSGGQEESGGRAGSGGQGGSGGRDNSGPAAGAGVGRPVALVPVVVLLVAGLALAVPGPHRRRMATSWRTRSRGSRRPRGR